MASNSEFSFIDQDLSKAPHKFIAFKHHSDNDATFLETVKTCLKAWRITADAYKSVGDTGFKSDNIARVLPLLNEIGKSRLPSTPVEDENITKCPFITDITEIISMNLIKSQYDNIVLPYPRVLHKELKGNQHKGIDLLGYIENQDGHILLIIEVMASVENSHPASTVRAHLRQLLDETLNGYNERLLNELEYILDEADDSHKDTINGFLVALYGKELNNKGDVLAVPVMVRPVNKWNNNDWKPFLSAIKEFEQAEVPSTVNYFAIECDCNFSELLDRIKAKVI